MADMSLDELVLRLNTFMTEKVPKRCLEVMKEETPVGLTGNLKMSIQVTDKKEESFFVGTSLSYAHDVEHGSDKPGSWYPDYRGNRKSIHKRQDTEWSTIIHPARRGKNKGHPANPFVQRTYERLLKEDWKL